MIKNFSCEEPFAFSTYLYDRDLHIHLQPILNEVPTPKKEFIDSSNNVGFKYCSNCGNKFEDAFKCLKCGENVNIWDVFCMNCGNKL